MSQDGPGFTVSFEVGGRRLQTEVTKARAVLGRSPTCDIVIPEERVSRQHATILRENNDWTVFDMGSANGTFLNDRPIVKSVLHTGDVISVGEVEIAFEDKSPKTTGPHRVVIEDEHAKRNKTAVFNMAELSVISHISSVSEAGGTRTDAAPAAAWAIALFSQAAQALLSSQDLDDVLEKVLELVFKNLPVERGVIALYDETNGIVPRITRARADVRRDDTIRISQTIAQEAIRLKQAILVGDVTRDERFGSEDSILAMNISSAMCAPLYNEGRVSGLIYVDNRDPRNAFTADQLKLLSAVGVFAAVALEQTRLREKITREERIRERLEKYNSKAVVDKIVQGAITGTQNAIGDMIADEREVSVIFADLCGFTTMSETLKPHEVAQVLNGVFGQLTDAIFEFDGTLDKFMGDALMAFFGAPLDQPDHARRAVRTALAMKKRLEDFNADIGSGQKVEMRIGINSGSVVAGDIGSSERKDYTVIGDTVNVASRLESSVAKPGEIVIGPTTYELVKDDVTCEPLGEVKLKGKELMVVAFRVIGG